MHYHSKITGTGSYVPPRVVPNSEIAQKLNTTDAWIQEKIGIKERRYVENGVGPSDLAFEAAKRALESAGKTSGEIDCILFATSTPDYNAPGSGVLLQHKLGCHRIPAFDIRNTSPGWLFSLELGDNLIRSGKYRCILVVASEVHSTALDFSPNGRLMSVIFGDGAGAVILEPTEGDEGIITTRLHSDGEHFDKLWCEGPSSKQNPRISKELMEAGHFYPTMDGRFVFQNAVRLMSIVCEEVLAEQNLKNSDIDVVIPHQANLRIIEAIAEKMNIPMKKVFHNIERVGNTNGASIPIALDEAHLAGFLKKGSTILAMSFGSGFSWGATLFKWGI